MPDIIKITDLDIITLFKECTPKLLVVSDTNIGFGDNVDFGLSQFVATLRASTIHAMTPTVITASHDPQGTLSYNAATKHITNFRFDDPTHGIVKSRYDVVFLLGFDGEGGATSTTPTELEAIGKFMQAGGGVFATGDHEDLGYALAGQVPRVRAMRHWSKATTPNIGNTTRLSTNLPGLNDAYEFNDQSDAQPQRLYVNYRTVAGGIGAPHPVLQVPRSPRAIEVFPDHPHEGECHLPRSLGTSFTVGGAAVPEWPAGVAPEAVAITMSHGDSFPGKEALAPRSFMSICAYDGQRAGVGRVVTDATWHHFMNINLTPSSSVGPGLAGRDLSDVKQYYANLATWLMPRSVRMCLRLPLIVRELQRFPLIEELRLPPVEKMGGDDFRVVGEQVRAALSLRLTRAEVAELMADALDEGAGPAADVMRKAVRLGRAPVEDLGLVALGGLVAGVATTLPEALRDKKDLHAVGDGITGPGTRLAVKRYLPELKRELMDVGKALERVE